MENYRKARVPKHPHLSAPAWRESDSGKLQFDRSKILFVRSLLRPLFIGHEQQRDTTYSITVHRRVPRSAGSISLSRVRPASDFHLRSDRSLTNYSAVHSTVIYGTCYSPGLATDCAKTRRTCYSRQGSGYNCFHMPLWWSKERREQEKIPRLSWIFKPQS